MSHGLDLPGPPTWSVDAAITSQIYQENCPLSSIENMESGQNLPSTGTNANGVQETDVNIPVFDGSGDYVRNILPTVQTRASPPHAPAGAMDMQGHASPPVGHIMNDIMGMPQTVIPTIADAQQNLHLAGMVDGAGKRWGVADPEFPPSLPLVSGTVSAHIFF